MRDRTYPPKILCAHRRASKLPKDKRQNTAIAVVLSLNRRIDADLHFETLLGARIIHCAHHRPRASRKRFGYAFSVKSLLTRQFQRLQVLAGQELHGRSEE